MNKQIWKPLTESSIEVNLIEERVIFIYTIWNLFYIWIYYSHFFTSKNVQ